MQRAHIFLLSGCLLLISPLAISEVYRWVDDRGKVHFGDKPPSQDAQQIKIKPPPSNASPSNLKPSPQDFRKLEEGLLKAYAERKTIEKEKRTQQKKEKAKRDKACAKAQADYNDYDGYRRYNEDKSGDKVFLNEAEIQADKAGLKNWLNTNCR